MPPSQTLSVPQDRFFELSLDLLCEASTKDGRFTRLNSSWERTLGYRLQDLLSRPFIEFVHPDDHAITAQASATLAAGDTVVAFTNRYRHQDGSYRVLSWNASVDSERQTVYAVARDISAQREAEQRLLQMNKLEAIGQLAAGVAHEINTPAQFLSDNLQFMETSIKDLLKSHQIIQRIIEGGDVSALIQEAQNLDATADMEYLITELPNAITQARDGIAQIAQIAKSLKAFSHPGSQDAKPVDLAGAIRTVLIMARNEYRYVADVKLEMPDDVPMVRGNTGEICQIFINLVVNAAHAITDAKLDSRGKITITVVPNQKEVVVSIADTGTGMSDEVRKHIFQPFFTTKEAGRGTGQGMHIIRSLVVKHHGSISFDSELGRGTTFTVTLPLA